MTVNVTLGVRLVPINSMRLGSHRKVITQQLPLNALMGVSALLTTHRHVQSEIGKPKPELQGGSGIPFENHHRPE